MHLPKALVYSAIAAWSAAVVGGYLWITTYGFATNWPADSFSREKWPRASSLKLAVDRPTLVIFVHPKCPCTRATVRELERIATADGLTQRQRPKVIAVASLPLGATEDWRNSGTIASIRRLPNSSVLWDVDGTESKGFGAVTSGTVMLFRPDGTRVFAGGITASRGHEGDNTSADRLVAALIDPAAAKASTPVFGCRLFLNESKPVFVGTGEVTQPQSMDGASP
jgi:hypothetical protein